MAKVIAIFSERESTARSLSARVAGESEASIHGVASVVVRHTNIEETGLHIVSRWIFSPDPLDLFIDFLSSTEDLLLHVLRESKRASAPVGLCMSSDSNDDTRIEHSASHPKVHIPSQRWNIICGSQRSTCSGCSMLR